MTNELQLLDNIELRNKNIGRVEVLERVKQLLLLPNTEYATTKQVAEYFEVPVPTVADVVFNNREEIESDGMKTIDNYNNLVSLFSNDTKLEKKRGFVLVNDEIRLPYSKQNIFTKRSILRIAMLLCGSDVAKEIRTRLLDIAHDVQTQQPQIISNIVDEIETEQQIEEAKKKLASEIVEAFMKGDTQTMFIKTTEKNNLDNKLLEIKNKRINETQERLEYVIKNELTFEEFDKKFRKIISAISGFFFVGGGNEQNLYSDFYKYLAYKKGIRVKVRQENAQARIQMERELIGKKPYSQSTLNSMVSKLSTIKEHEYEEVLTILKAWAVHKGLGIDYIENLNKLD